MGHYQSKGLSFLMDQQECEQDDFTVNFMRQSQQIYLESKIFSGSQATNVKEYCKELGVGRYMTINDRDKVSILWKQMLDVIQMINENFQQRDKSPFYIVKRLQNGNISIQSNPLSEVPIKKTITQKQQQEQKQQVEILLQKYSFIVNEEDQRIVQIHIIDPQGLNFLTSIGPPTQLRWSCWKTIVLSESKNILVSQQEIDKIDHKVTDQINKDIGRTLCSHPYFQENDMLQGKQQLNRLLCSVAGRFPKLGYCQGMNFIGGFLLMVSGCDEQLSYEIFINTLINPKYLLYFIYCDQLPLLDLIQNFVRQILFEQDIDLYKHIDQLGVPDSFWMSKIIISIFLCVIKLQQCLRIWDYFITRGIIGIIELILGLIHTIRDNILQSDLESFGKLFQGQRLVDQQKQNQDHEVDIEQVIFNARTKFKIKKTTVPQLTKIYCQNRQNLNQIVNCFLHYNNQNQFKLEVQQFLNLNDIV